MIKHRTASLGSPALRKRTFLATAIRSKGLLLLLAPGFLLFLIFNYLPIGGIILAFKNVNYTKGIFASPWVGFDNFKLLLTSQDAFRITEHTIVYNLLFIVTITAVSVAFALMLYELGKKAVKLYQTVFFLPYFISWVVASYIAYIFLSSEQGVFNTFLKAMGMQPYDWYTETKYWPVIFIVANIWKNMGYNTILYYTACVGIDPSYYEVSSIDGASKWQQVRHITIPLITPLITMLTLLAVGRIFYSDFGIFYFLTKNSGPLYPVSDVIDTYVYRALTNTGDIGIAAATGLYQSLVGFIIVLGSNLAVRKINPDYSMF